LDIATASASVLNLYSGAKIDSAGQGLAGGWVKDINGGVIIGVDPFTIM